MLRPRDLYALCAALLLTAALISPAQAQDAPKPFGLPFATDPGPETWLLGQVYGNTQSAYRFRVAWYQAGQGMHFGVDFSAPCGTQIIAVGAGEVVAIDDLARGAGPHNLIIYHDNGMVSLYGHLLRPAELYIGQRIERGQPIALTGDPDLTCASRPHLHLELRSPNYNIAYNPLNYIEADWDAMALSSRHLFQRDLDNPRRWQTFEDQPTVDFWGPILNDYARSWPPAW